MDQMPNRMLGPPYPRQFAALPHETSALEGWQHAVLGTTHVYAHPTLQIVGASDSLDVILLGFLLDPEHPELTDHDLLRAIAAAPGLADAVWQSSRLAGRYVLLIADQGQIYALNDPCGLRSICYHTTDDGVYLASNPALLGRLTPIRSSAHATEYRNSTYARNELEPWIPSGETLYENVGHLVPNHYLELGRSNQVRYWPRSTLTVRSVDAAIPLAAALLEGHVRAAGNRFPLALPLTAGMDSRILLAAARYHTHDVFAYTLQYGKLTGTSPDIRIPRRILSSLHLEHHLIEADAAAPNWFMDAYREYVDLAHDYWGQIAWGLVRGYPRERICLKGNCAEIYRNYYRHLRADPSPAAIAAEAFGDLGFAIDSVRRWMEAAHDACAATGIDALDLFYWEHRMGSWQARSQLEWDVAQESVTPYNHRPLLEVLLGVPWTDEDPTRARLSHGIVRHLWPDLDRWPVNPPPPLTQIKRLARTVLSSIGLLDAARSAGRLVRAAGRRTPASGGHTSAS